ncbi:helix-turn-helix domain-containing protein [Lentzea aerocolonigenes]|uniref:helix-turn-helix domain-containing protein n=1 Tax=Lentzea aerocolonigenes TaxID=68170 RepID=UPI000569933F|nr:helix-turn-helix transcriptional regulator [Lentzea aerocolonigenes]MCP2245745.1 DNA-binding transcriptional regulator, XRE-family HTH domain [Lentzea aerocolonigenes]
MRWTDDAIDQLYETIGSNIRNARMRAGVTQADLGKRLQLTRSSIANIEAGRQRVMIHWIMQIADEFKVPLETLLEQPDEMIESRVSAELVGQPDSTQEFVISVIRQADPE